MERSRQIHTRSERGGEAEKNNCIDNVSAKTYAPIVIKACLYTYYKTLPHISVNNRMALE